MNISVVIPTLNETDCIASTIQSVRAVGDFEIIVADGGSTDDTVLRARDADRVVIAERGRAVQMNAGAASAQGDVLVFLHADTALPSDAPNTIGRAIADPAVGGGCFRVRFVPGSPLLRFYSACTSLPLKSFCFGDRALFVRSEVFRLVNGFKPIPIFEDLEMVKEIARVGRFVRLKSYVETSGRRFSRNGILRQQLLNTYLWLRYHLGTDPQTLARFYRYDSADETVERTSSSNVI